MDQKEMKDGVLKIEAYIQALIKLSRGLSGYEQYPFLSLTASLLDETLKLEDKIEENTQHETAQGIKVDPIGRLQRE